MLAIEGEVNIAVRFDNEWNRTHDELLGKASMGLVGVYRLWSLLWYNFYTTQKDRISVCKTHVKS